ncbi:MAG TPA: response regulator transcription factor [Feifaniaceae bacterium]|nr:response regulator transcription factor [Feifaniaceae bacterium]
MEKTTVLVVDDDNEIRELVETLLQSEGYRVIQAPGGKQAIDLMTESIDLVVLDVMMPEMSGYKVCSAIRESYNVPILFLTAKGMDSDLVMGYSSGGDDYLTKPFSCAELIARVKGLLRRYHVYKGKEEPERGRFYTCGSLRVHCDFNEVTKDDEEINLTELEYQLLRLMMQYQGKVFTTQNLYESVWNEPYFSASANTVMVHIRKLRAKIEGNPQEPDIVKTVWGKGYRIG